MDDRSHPFSQPESGQLGYVSKLLKACPLFSKILFVVFRLESKATCAWRMNMVAVTRQTCDSSFEAEISSDQYHRKVLRRFDTARQHRWCLPKTRDVMCVRFRAQELCESRGGRPELPSLTNLRFLDVKQHFSQPREPLCESRGGRPGLPFLINLRFLWTWLEAASGACWSKECQKVSVLFSSFPFFTELLLLPLLFLI